MAKYTYKDIIIDPQDERVKIGEKYYTGYTPTNCVQNANKEELLVELLKILLGSNFPFLIKKTARTEYVGCLIKPKEPEVKYVPFDLSKKEDRDALRGKWIKHKKYGTESLIDCFSIDTGKWYVNGYSAKPLFENFLFLDGSPVGKKVEK